MDRGTRGGPPEACQTAPELYVSPRTCIRLPPAVAAALRLGCPAPSAHSSQPVASPRWFAQRPRTRRFRRLRGCPASWRFRQRPRRRPSCRRRRPRRGPRRPRSSRPRPRPRPRRPRHSRTCSSTPRASAARRSRARPTARSASSCASATAASSSTASRTRPSRSKARAARCGPATASWPSDGAHVAAGGRRHLKELLARARDPVSLLLYRGDMPAAAAAGRRRRRSRGPWAP